MVDWRAYFIAAATVGLLALILRWATTGKGRSLVERRPRPGHADEYGLLVSIASPGTYVEGEVDRQRLEAAGIKAQLVNTVDGPRLMVFESDAAAARRLLAG